MERNQIAATARFRNRKTRLKNVIGEILPFQEKRFIFENGEENPPTKFLWKNEHVTLNNEVLKKIKLLGR